MRRPVFLLVVVLLAGCGGTTSHTAASKQAGGPATKRELHWLSRVGRWNGDVVEPFTDTLTSYVSAYGKAPVAPLLAASRRIASCPTSLPRTVGQPPTPRLASSYRALRAACAQFATVARSVVHARRSAIVFGQLATTPAHEFFDATTDLDTAVQRAIIGWRLHLPSRATGSHTDERLNRAAAAVAGKPVEVHCWSSRDWRRLGDEFAALAPRSRDVALAGWAYVGGTTVELEPSICAQLERLLAKGSRDTERDAFAVKVLAHEAMHASGVADEADAECYAIQEVPKTAAALGLARKGRTFARREWAEYPNEPAGYGTSLCVDGGALDVHPTSNVWP